jgi:hypothetical protein
LRSLHPVLSAFQHVSIGRQEINKLGKKARDGTISIDDMAGGTFTISNGGVYGSLLSTPIINPPQSAILGMHAITQRPMVVGKEILPRPIMNVALTYDHRSASLDRNTPKPCLPMLPLILSPTRAYNCIRSSDSRIRFRNMILNLACILAHNNGAHVRCCADAQAD